MNITTMMQAIAMEVVKQLNDGHCLVEQKSNDVYQTLGAFSKSKGYEASNTLNGWFNEYLKFNSKVQIKTQINQVTYKSRRYILVSDLNAFYDWFQNMRQNMMRKNK